MRKLIFVIISLAGFGSPGHAADPGVTNTEVLIGAHTAETGFAAIYSAMPRALTAYLDQVNAKGGVHGRKVKFVRIDTTGDQLRTVQATRKLVDQHKIFAMVGAMGPSHQAAYRYLIRKKVPDLFFNDGIKEYGTPLRKTVFPVMMESEVEGRVLAEYIAAKFKGKRVCFLITDNATGEEFLAGAKKALQKANESLGAGKKMSVGIIERIERRAAQANSSVLALKRDKCGVVMSTTFSTLAPNAITYATSQNFSPLWALMIWNTHPKFFELIPEKAHRNVISTGMWALSADFGAKGWAEYEALMKKADIPISLISVIGYTMAESFIEALRRAGRELTRAKVVTAVESMNGWQCGLCLKPLEYSVTNHWPVRSASVVIAKDKRWALESL